MQQLMQCKLDSDLLELLDLYSLVISTLLSYQHMISVPSVMEFSPNTLKIDYKDYRVSQNDLNDF